MKDEPITTLADLRATMARVSFERSCLDMGWRWEAEMMSVQDGPRMVAAWRIRCSFRRPDTHTGTIGTGFGRWWLIDPGATISGVVKTMWLAAYQIVDHEMHEAFKFDGERPFDPHRTVQDLVSTASRPVTFPAVDRLAEMLNEYCPGAQTTAERLFDYFKIAVPVTAHPRLRELCAAKAEAHNRALERDLTAG